MSGQIISPPPNVPPPAPTVQMGELLVIGDVKVSEIKGVKFEVEYEAERKVTEKDSDGDDDATAVDGGRKVRKVTVKLEWASTAEANKRAAPILALDVSNKDTGNPPAWAHQRNGLDLAKIKNVRFVKFKTSKGPNSAAGSGVEKYELSGDSWSKVTKGTAKTEKDGRKFVLGSESKYNGATEKQAAEMKKQGVPMQGDKPKAPKP